MATVQKYFDIIARYDEQFSQWRTRVEKILKKYKDDTTNSVQFDANVKFNILWSNVQTLSAATFAKLPKADVRRRFQDQDPVARIASAILERALTYELEQYSDYAATLRQCIMDRFLGGRGTAWARYEPHMRAAQFGLPTDGVQITEDIDEPKEELDYECSPVDYVHWQDFGHDVARTWEEVSCVWRKVYLDKAGVEARFGAKIAEKVPYDADPQRNPKTYGGSENQNDKACIYEIWNKTTKQAIWISKGITEPLDEIDDPLGMAEFWPCPRPLYATLTSDALTPLPDFTLYQDQAAELDLLANRIDGLVKGLKIRGTYDASIPALSRIFDEDTENALVPVENWNQFTEKNGLRGALDLVQIEPIANCLQNCYQAMEQIKGQVYEISGISDIIRGQTLASETATAQQLKGQYASLRLKAYQDEVSRFATEMLRLKAQIICGKFAPETILKMASADQFSPVDQQLIQPAMQLLLGERLINPESTSDNPLRTFRIDVAADSMVYLDEQEEKDNRVEFLTACGQFLSQAVQIAKFSPDLAPLLLEMVRFGASGFKAARALEGIIDQTLTAFQQKMQQPPPPLPPDPKLEIEKMRAEIEAKVVPIQAQADIIKAQASVKVSENQIRQAQVEAMTPQMPPQGAM